MGGHDRAEIRRLAGVWPIVVPPVAEVRSVGVYVETTMVKMSEFCTVRCLVWCRNPVRRSLILLSPAVAPRDFGVYSKRV